jgi:hypothetical protein
MQGVLRFRVHHVRAFKRLSYRLRRDQVDILYSRRQRGSAAMASVYLGVFFPAVELQRRDQATESACPDLNLCYRRSQPRKVHGILLKLSKLTNAAGIHGCITSANYIEPQGCISADGFGSLQMSL